MGRVGHGVAGGVTLFLVDFLTLEDLKDLNVPETNSKFAPETSNFWFKCISY